MKCFLEPNCVSINVGPADDQGRRPCELNDITDEKASQSGLEERTGYIHYAVEVSDIFAINLDYLQRFEKLIYQRRSSCLSLVTKKWLSLSYSYYLMLFATREFHSFIFYDKAGTDD